MIKKAIDAEPRGCFTLSTVVILFQIVEIILIVGLANGRISFGGFLLATLMVEAIPLAAIFG